MKALSFLVFAALTPAFASVSSAADGVFLPPAPSGSGGQDSISTPGGLDCRQSLNTGGPILDLGFAGGAGQQRGKSLFATEEDDDFFGLGYARIVIPLGERPKRIDCSQIFHMEVERLRRELELLEAAIE